MGMNFKKSRVLYSDTKAYGKKDTGQSRGPQKKTTHLPNPPSRVAAAGVSNVEPGHSKTVTKAGTISKSIAKQKPGSGYGQVKTEE